MLLFLNEKGGAGMAAKKAPRWGVHYGLVRHWRFGLYAARSSFTVRARTKAGAQDAARRHPAARAEPFVVIRISG